MKMTKILDKIARSLAWVVTWGEPDHPKGNHRFYLTAAIILLLGWLFA